MNLARPWTVLAGDCRATLADLNEESVDAVVTDTPYGLSTILDPPNLDREALWRKLMQHNRNRRPLRAYVGDALDAFIGREHRPPEREEFLCLVDAAERQRLLEGPALERLIKTWLDTGENPALKGRGFMGKEWDALVPPPNTWRVVWRVAKPGAYNLAFGGTRTADLITLSLRLADFEIEDTWAWLQGQGMAKRVRLDLKIDEHFGMKDKRPVTGHHMSGASAGMQHLGPSGIKGGAYESHDAATPEAARFVGWDRASAPKYEPIIIAVKPLRGTIAQTALRYGTGGMNADGCRIPRGERGDAPVMKTASGDGFGFGFKDNERAAWDARGGFPANVIIDEETAAELDRQSGMSHSGTPRDDRGTGGVPCGPQYGDEGGASRFFYTAKASTSERDKGLEDLPVLTPGERSGGREEDSAGINGYAGTRGENGRNPHPCLKPISLMRYLVRRACPPGAHDPDISRRPVVLDCFMGSGSTGVAAMIEGVRFIGCEMVEEYVQVARLRLQHAYALPPEDAPDAPMTRVGGQGKLF